MSPCLDAYNEAEQLLYEQQKAKTREFVSQQRKERLRVLESIKGRVPALKT